MRTLSTNLGANSIAWVNFCNKDIPYPDSKTIYQNGLGFRRRNMYILDWLGDRHHPRKRLSEAFVIDLSIARIRTGSANGGDGSKKVKSICIAWIHFCNAMTFHISFAKSSTDQESLVTYSMLHKLLFPLDLSSTGSFPDLRNPFPFFRFPSFVIHLR